MSCQKSAKEQDKFGNIIGLIFVSFFWIFNEIETEREVKERNKLDKYLLDCNCDCLESRNRIWQ
jgi:hypothetical protein